ncbi:MAG: rhomboid-like protein [Candidatus Nanopelagicales bacterium]
MHLNWQTLQANANNGPTVWPFIGAAILFGLALAWFVIKAEAHRSRLVGLRDKLQPQVSAIHAYVLTAPATFVYIAIFSATSGIQKGSPDKALEIITRTNSTNIAELLTDPFRVLISSALLVADNGFFWIGYVVVFVMIAARLEQRVGSARWLVIAVMSHVVGTLLTVTVETLLVHFELLPKSTVVTADVGVSYIMVGTCGAYLWLVTKRWRIPYFVAVGAGILGPLIFSHQIWDLGHFLATSVGVLTGWWMIRIAPLHPRLVWKQIAGGEQRVELIRP